MKTVSAFFTLFISILFIFSSCKSKETQTTEGKTADTTTFDLAAIKPIIEEQNSKWSNAVVNSDSVYMVNYYTEDAKIFMPNAEPIVGRTAIAATISQIMKFGIKEYRDETTALYGNEDNLIEEGNYFMGDGKGNVMDRGKYMAIWRKVNGEWKVYSNIFNTSLPPAPAAK